MILTPRLIEHEISTIWKLVVKTIVVSAMNDEKLSVIVFLHLLMSRYPQGIRNNYPTLGSVTSNLTFRNQIVTVYFIICENLT